MKKRNPETARKVRELRRLLGGRRAVVRAMAAASSSSLKRWEWRECRPIRAHVYLVDDTYRLVTDKICRMAERIGKAMLRKSRKRYKRL